jgi:hypothetical protein
MRLLSIVAAVSRRRTTSTPARPRLLLRRSPPLLIRGISVSIYFCLGAHAVAPAITAQTQAARLRSAEGRSGGFDVLTSTKPWACRSPPRRAVRAAHPRGPRGIYDLSIFARLRTTLITAPTAYLPAANRESGTLPPRALR